MIIDFIGIMFELYFYTLLFNSLWKKKVKVPSVIFYIGVVLLLCAVTYIPQLKTINVIVIPVVLLGLTYVYEAKWLSRLFYVSFIYIGGLLAEIVVGLAMTFILGGSVEEHMDSLYFYTCGVIFSKFIMYLIIRILLLRRERRMNTGFVNKIPQMVALSIVTAYVTMVIFFLSYESDNEFVTLLTVLAVILLIVANILIFVFSDKVLLQEMKLQRLTFAEEQLKLQEEHYKEIVDKQREISRIKHDMNNYLLSLSGYISDNQKELALEKIKEQVEHIQKEDYIKCDNFCVAALLNAKYHTIQEKKITFDYFIQLPGQVFVDEIELCIVIGNLLDNAIEACCKFEENEDRKIFMEIKLVEAYIFINISNSVCEGYEPRKDGKTIKAEKEMHGFGKETINTIAKKYDGNAQFTYEEHIFTASVMLKNV